jgi:hypothetical protein
MAVFFRIRPATGFDYEVVDAVSLHVQVLPSAIRHNLGHGSHRNSLLEYHFLRPGGNHPTAVETYDILVIRRLDDPAHDGHHACSSPS